jgi:ZIP family zinc transporter
MIYISFMEILPAAIKNIKLYEHGAGANHIAIVVFFAGIGFMALTAGFLAPKFKSGNTSSDNKKRQVLLVGFLASIGIVVHNLPEGMAAFLSSAYDIKSGLMIVLAISIHNIPEGLCIAGTIYYATKSRKKAFLAALLSGAAEPIGGVLAFLLFKDNLNMYTISIIYSVAAGIMVYISLEELFVNARKYGDAAWCFGGWIFGMILVSAGLML